MQSPELIKTMQKIEAKITALESARAELIDAAIDKANAVSNYDRQLSITILKLKNGLIESFEGLPSIGLPATLIEKVAKGIIYQAAFDKESAEDIYKSKVISIEAIRAELNGLQSINKYVE